MKIPALKPSLALFFLSFLALPLDAGAANYTVNVFDDPSIAAPPNGCASSGRCSLREAVLSANVSGDASSTITLPAGSYTLSLTGSDNTGFAGDLDILNHDLTISGAGADTTTINASALNDRIFDIPSDASVINVVIQGLTLTGGKPTGDGGAIEFINNGGDTLTVGNCALDNNQASGNGGGLAASGGTVTLNNVTVSNNRANYGGGTHSDNSAALNLNNVTVSGNQATNNSGGINGNTSSAIKLRSATVYNNTAGGSGGGVGFGFGANVNIANSILVGNTSSANPNCFAGTAAGAFASAGYNMFGDMGNCSIGGSPTGDQNSLTGAGLKPLGNYGGPTQTHQLDTGSLAINKGNPAGCVNTAGATLSSDQRGQNRPAATICDVGAVELGTVDLSVTNTASTSSPSSGQNVTYTLTVTNGGPNIAFAVVLTDALPSGSAFVSATASNGSACSESSGTVTCTLGQINNGNSVSVSVIASANGSGTNTASVTGAESDSNSANNSASVNITVSGGGSGGCSLQQAMSGNLWNLTILGSGLAALFIRRKKQP